MQVAIPEFDGRLITVPFSFKEPGPDGVPVYRADPERAARVAGIALGYARLRAIPNAEKRLAIVLSSYPTKHSRVGNAVGLDTPASAVALLAALKDAGYDVGDVPTDGDTLIHTLIAAGGHDVEWLTEEQLANAPIRVPGASYRAVVRGNSAGPAGRDDPALGRAARRALRRQRRDRAGRPALRQRHADDPAAARLRREPDRHLPRPGPAAVAPLPGRVPLARRQRGRRHPPRQARHAGVAARQGARPVRRRARRTPCSATCRWSTRSSSTTRARAPRPSGGVTPRSSTTWCRRWPAPTRTATWPSWSNSSTSTPPSPRSTREGARRCGRRSGP